jgi:hypothetical protein
MTASAKHSPEALSQAKTHMVRESSADLTIFMVFVFLV